MPWSRKGVACETVFHCWCISCVCAGKQSRRLTARKKYKIERKVHPRKICLDFCLYGNKVTVFMFDLKVREHKRKMRKEAKQKAKSKSQCSAVHFASLDFILLSCTHTHTLVSPEIKKDPGIPNLYPFKEQLLKQIEEKKVKAEEERERQKRQRQREHAKRRSLQGLQNDARKRTKEFEKRVSYWEQRVCALLQ